MRISLDVAVEAVREWQKVQFPNATPQGCANHLLSEAKELAERPTDPDEMADILMLLIGCAAAAGVDLAEALIVKLAINKVRVWGEENEAGFIEHVKE